MCYPEVLLKRSLLGARASRAAVREVRAIHTYHLNVVSIGESHSLLICSHPQPFECLNANIVLYAVPLLAGAVSGYVPGSRQLADDLATLAVASLDARSVSTSNLVATRIT